MEVAAEEKMEMEEIIVEWVEEAPEKVEVTVAVAEVGYLWAICLLYTSPSPRDRQKSRMPSSA